MKKIVIFASGNGSNALNIYNFFNKEELIIKSIITNNLKAGVIEKFKETKIPIILINKEILNSFEFLELLNDVDYIILAGFLLKIPEFIVKKFEKRIINIHPSLLPKYGGKGMYGMNVHKKVIENKEIESGITIHFVDKEYDTGSEIFQQKIDISNIKNAEDLALEIAKLEKKYFPQILKDKFFFKLNIKQ